MTFNERIKQINEGFEVLCDIDILLQVICKITIYEEAYARDLEITKSFIYDWKGSIEKNNRLNRYLKIFNLSLNDKIVENWIDNELEKFIDTEILRR